MIKKNSENWELIPNLLDYDAARENFSWEHELESLDGLPDGGLNIAFEAVDRHAAGERRGHLALRWLDRDGRATDFSYGDLGRLSNRFANVLRDLGVEKGERVFALSERLPALYIAALGTLKNGSVFCPLFSAFGPEPLHSRLSIGEAKVLVTTESLYRRKVAALRDSLPQLQHLLLVREKAQGGLPEGTLDFQQLLDGATEEFSIVQTDPEDPALLHFTSGTTGKPKGAIHVHKAVVAHHASARLALDLHPQDVFWCTADPGWVTGTSYGIIAPLIIGATMIVDREEFEPERWYGILRDQKVSVWYTAPTAVRMMMKYGAELARQFELPALRFMASVGEPLNPEAVLWGQEAFDLPFHDNWWQTETGGIMIANFLSQPIRPGSMGRPLPGIEAAIVRLREDGAVELIEEAGKEGELALKRGWPSMFRGYLHEDERYRKCFRGDWYLTGDLARRDEDGYFWFVGRADDVIKSSGHLIGPFEVESALMEHPAVAEAAVIGVPDPVALEVVKAFVSLKPGHKASDPLRTELLAFARQRLGPAVAPRQIEIEDSLPRTRSGKIMRRLLKARELGLPEGDTSTLEGGD
ncbi:MULTISPECIES: acetate--CoA ligase [unclassified Microbulbifer]|uniref:acetate--CoA ligase n=1 Tax=unclassified Microbulbifer TaxID=2619833 RepID=UPI0027E555C7|nr:MULTISPECIES: acetate--CoA ligase [unclassified Microbulbifer]